MKWSNLTFLFGLLIGSVATGVGCAFTGWLMQGDPVEIYTLNPEIIEFHGEQVCGFVKA